MVINPIAGEIKTAPWTDFPEGLLSSHKIGSSCRVRLPGYPKNKNHFVLPVSIQYVDNKQKLRGRKFVRTKFLKRQIYGYFYNNLRIDKPDKLTRKDLNEFYREERIHRSQEYQKLMKENGWSRADLARHLGVSRAWVTIVMRDLK